MSAEQCSQHDENLRSPLAHSVVLCLSVHTHPEWKGVWGLVWSSACCVGVIAFQRPWYELAIRSIWRVDDAKCLFHRFFTFKNPMPSCLFSVALIDRRDTLFSLFAYSARLIGTIKHRRGNSSFFGVGKNLNLHQQKQHLAFFMLALSMICSLILARLIFSFTCLLRRWLYHDHMISYRSPSLFLLVNYYLI